MVKIPIHYLKDLNTYGHTQSWRCTSNHWRTGQEWVLALKQKNKNKN